MSPLLVLATIATLIAIEFFLRILTRSCSRPARSNLSDEFAYSSAGDINPCRIKALVVYPIKSCRGVEQQEADVVATGLRWDRQFTFAELHDNEGWKFITQRQYPKLTCVEPMLRLPEGRLRVRFPGSWWERGQFEVPLEVGTDEFPLRKVTIWKEAPQAYDVTAAIPPHQLRRLRAFIGCERPIALFRICPHKLREVYRCAPTKGTLGHQPVTAFADAYPLHILNLSSVRHLNEQTSAEIPQLSALRFRANIILTGPRAFDEDSWKRFKIGREEYYAACRTVRCKMPNIDPISGEKHAQEPDQTMRKYRCVDVGAKNNGCLGMQVVAAREEGAVVRVGDIVVVQERGEHLYIPQ